MYLSFDCAEKSCGICLMGIDKNKNNELNDDIKGGDIKIYMIRVVNIVGDSVSEEKNKTSKLIYKTRLIKKFINDLDTEIKNMNINIDTVLLEYQMSINYKSSNLLQQLIYHYCDKYEIHLMGPSLKNKIYFSDELKHSVFIEKYMSNYTANKNHTKHNFLFWIRHNNLSNKIKNIKKKNIDDIADAFIQVIAFINYKS